jgi:hypothetical protein
LPFPDDIFMPNCSDLSFLGAANRIDRTSCSPQGLLITWPPCSPVIRLNSISINSAVRPNRLPALTCKANPLHGFLDKDSRRPGNQGQLLSFAVKQSNPWANKRECFKIFLF